jgi:hypothetical protein
MATFTPIKNQKQSKGALLGTMLYAINKRKTTYEGQSLVSGFNCSAYTAYLEMMTTAAIRKRTTAILSICHSFRGYQLARRFTRSVWSLPPGSFPTMRCW